MQAFLQLRISGFTGGTVVVTSVAVLGTTSVLVLYNFVSEPTTYVTSTNINALASAITSDSANVYGITSVVLATTASPTSSPVSVNSHIAAPIIQKCFGALTLAPTSRGGLPVATSNASACRAVQTSITSMLLCAQQNGIPYFVCNSLCETGFVLKTVVTNAPHTLTSM